MAAETLGSVPESASLSTGNEKAEIVELRRAFEKRWRTLRKRSERAGLNIPDKEVIWVKVRNHWSSGFNCEYCRKRMLVKDVVGGLRSFSLEHRDPLHFGGDSSVDNIAISCARCNTEKGTLSAEEFTTARSSKIPGVSQRLKQYFLLEFDGWTSRYRSVNKWLRHFSRRSRSHSTRGSCLGLLMAFCCTVGMNPDQLVALSKRKIETALQSYIDQYDCDEYSRRTANTVLASLRSFFAVNGFKGPRSLDVEGLYTPKRYRKEKEYIPTKHEIYLMADSAGSLRDRAIILVLYSLGRRNSDLRALRYGDVKEELLKGVSMPKVPVYPEMKLVDPNACKNNLPYYSFACEEATQALKLYLLERVQKYGNIQDEDPLFASEYNQISKEARNSKILTPRQVQKVVKQCARSAGSPRWKECKPHSLRKAYESMLRSETIDGGRLDPKVQEFFMGHTLEGSQDNYFDSTKVEELRAEYCKLKWGRPSVENKFQKMRVALARAFEGTGLDPDDMIEEYLEWKKRMKVGSPNKTDGPISGSKTAA